MVVAGTVGDIMEKVEIDKNKPLKPGDRIEMYFKTTGMVWITAAQIAIIEYRLAGRQGFRILSWSLAGPNTVIFTVQVKKTNPVIVTAAVIGVAIIGAGKVGTAIGVLAHRAKLQFVLWSEEMTQWIF